MTFYRLYKLFRENNHSVRNALRLAWKVGRHA